MNTKPRNSRAPHEGREQASARAVEVAVVVVWRSPAGSGRGPEILLTRRPQNVHLPGSWELPGGKIKAGESVEQAARRELAEEVGLEFDSFQPLICVEHAYPDRCVRLNAVTARLDGEQEPMHLGVTDHRWVPLANLAAFELPPANAPITAAIIERFPTEPA